jgi:hypothetical protein
VTDGVVRGNGTQPDGDGFGAIVLGAATFARTVFDANGSAGVFVVEPGANAELTDVVVRATAWRPTTEVASGIYVQNGGHVTATRVLVDANHDTGTRCLDEGSTLELRDALVRGTAPHDRVTTSAELVCLGGATCDVARSTFATTGALNVTAQSNAVLRLTQSYARGSAIGGVVQVTSGARASIARVAVTDGRPIGLFAAGARSRLDVVDAVVRTTRPMPARPVISAGLVGLDGAELRAARVVVDDGVYAGVAAIDAAVTLTDVLVSRVGSSVDAFGLGAYASGAASLTLERVAVSDVQAAALAALAATGAATPTLRATDAYVSRVNSAPLEVDALSGLPTSGARLVAYGLAVGRGGDLSATRAVLVNGGFGFYNDAGRLALRDAVIAAQLDAAGAARSADAAAYTALAAVRFVGNAVNAVVTDGTLPALATLPAPTPPCLDLTCP